MVAAVVAIHLLLLLAARAVAARAVIQRLPALARLELPTQEVAVAAQDLAVFLPLL